MPLGDAYVDDALDAVVASWPSSGANYHLYASDPDGLPDPSTVELAATGGYAPVAFAPSDFAASSGGLKLTSSAISFGVSTAAYSATANYWGIEDSGGAQVYSAELTKPITVDDAGTNPAFIPALSFVDGA